MKRVLKMVNLDCANCAAKMETAIQKIEGVQQASISFMAQRLVLEADEAHFDDILKQVVKACKKVEPSCTVQL